MPPQLLEKLKPEFVTALVVYLCSEQCQDSGTIINCAIGYYSRSAIVNGPGAIISDGKRIPEPEEIMDNWTKIMSLDKVKTYNQLNEIFGEFGSLLQ
jgi:hypothetical protein